MIVEDRRTPTPDGRPIIDLGLELQVPDVVLADLKAKASVHQVVLEADGRSTAPGRLDLGRSQRLANKAQRRVLRALYPTCAIPGCPVRYQYLHIHHVDPYESGGNTDLGRLLPLCCKHHHKVHDDGWNLHLATDRTLTITLPDGTIMTTGPPSRAAV